jgi:hypothetical protein
MGYLVEDRLEGSVVAVDVGDDEEPQRIHGSTTAQGSFNGCRGKEPLTGLEAF